MKEPSAAQWLPVSPVPRGSPKPPAAHVARGRPLRSFEYRDFNGELLGYRLRFRKKSTQKLIDLPLTWCMHSKGSLPESWRFIEFAVPRPLFNLHNWTARVFDSSKELPVLLCVDEDTAEHATAVLGRVFNVVSWHGGFKTLDKTDFSPLANLDVWIWPESIHPDAKRPGLVAAAAGDHIADIARVVLIAQPRAQRPPHWKVQDAIDFGWDENDLTAFLQNVPEPAMPPAAPVPPQIPAVENPEWRLELKRATSGKMLDCRENVIHILENHPAWKGCVALDEFANRIQIRRKPDKIEGFQIGEWDAQHDVRLGLWLAFNSDETIEGTIKSEATISAAVNYVAHQHKFHPVRDYLDALEWDKKPRIDQWLTDFLGVKKNEYASMVGRFFLLSMVARIYEPGCIMRMVPILEGEQWRGKSTAVRILGGAFYSDTPFTVGDKDAYQSLQGNWLYEISELDSFSRAEATRIKSFVSSVVDDYRAPYDRRNKKWPRQCVFMATTNQDEYLKDSTGNTRFSPVRTGEILVDQLAAARDQLFAEAVFRYRSGERRFPTREEQDEHFKPEQDQREIADPWHDMIAEGLRTWTPRKITITEILREVLKVDASKIDNSRSMATRIGTALKREGWIKHRPAADASGRREAWYERPPMPLPTSNPAQPADSNEPPF